MQLTDVRDRMKRGLTEINEKAEAATARAGELTGRARDELKAQVDSLRQKQHRLAGMLDRLDARGSEGWDAIQPKVEKAWDEVKQASDRLTRWVRDLD